MESTQLPLNEIRAKITVARSVLIVLPQMLTVDSVAAGLALYLALKENFANGKTPESTKNITIATGADVTVAYQRLYSVGSISKSLGSKNLVITLNTAQENIEKVTSDNDNDKFNLVIETKAGIEKLESTDVTFGYRGVDADLVIAVGLATGDAAGDLLFQEEKLFSSRDVITIATNPGAVSFGTINLTDPQASSCCEITAKLLRFLKLEITADMATNLLAGIEASTNNFVIKSTAETFAAVSWCMRQGGQRNHLTKTNPAQSAFSNTANMPFGFGQNPFAPYQQPMPETSVIPQTTPPTTNPFPMTPQVPSFISELAQQSNEPQQENQPDQTIQSQDAQSGGDEAPSKDWLEPKIFRNNS